MARQRMTPADQERYGGPEWLDFADAMEWLDGLDYDALADIESQVRALLVPVFPDVEVSLVWVLTQLASRAKPAALLPMLRIRLWLSLICTGVQVPLADFKPHVYSAEFERPAEKPGADADPPSGSPESSPESTPATDIPASETSTSGSTPGSPSTTG